MNNGSRSSDRPFIPTLATHIEVTSLATIPSIILSSAKVTAVAHCCLRSQLVRVRTMKARGDMSVAGRGFGQNKNRNRSLVPAFTTNVEVTPLRTVKPAIILSSAKVTAVAHRGLQLQSVRMCDMVSLRQRIFHKARDGSLVPALATNVEVTPRRTVVAARVGGITDITAIPS